jgi:hypothetical protein
MERFFSKTKLAAEVRPGMTTPCLEWTAGRLRGGYGGFKVAGKTVRAHRMAWELINGPISNDRCVLHKCDNPPCARIDHLFLGSYVDNRVDCCTKGRQARGDKHGSHLHPERLSRGNAHWSRIRPERLARGDASGSRLHPETRPRGELHVRSKLTESNVKFIFQLRDRGWAQQRLAAEFGVSLGLIQFVLNRKIWKHVCIEGRL